MRATLSSVLHHEASHRLSGLTSSRSQLFREIQTQAIESQRQVSLVNTQVTAKKRELRLLQLTSSEIHQLPTGTNVYEGIGKMYVASRYASDEKAMTKVGGRTERGDC